MLSTLDRAPLQVIVVDKMHGDVRSPVKGIPAWPLVQSWGGGRAAPSQPTFSLAAEPWLPSEPNRSEPFLLGLPFTPAVSDHSNRLVAASAAQKTMLAQAARTLRVSANAALFLRSGGVRQPVEPGLGGSQAIVSARAPLNGQLAISARAVAALTNGQVRQTELAVGLGVRPLRSVPVEVVAERRIALSKDGRDAWQLRAIGGGQWESGGWRLEGYGQAGVVGTRSRDLFGDGEVRLSRPLAGPLRAGVLMAGAAQPRVSRLDVGPVLRADLPAGSTPVTVLASYRVRIAGNAAPGSGPALTLAASF